MTAGEFSTGKFFVADFIADQPASERRERRSLDELLIDNYWHRQNRNSQPEAECVNRVISYVLKTESVAGKDIDSIKRLTVVDQNIYESNPTWLGLQGREYLEKVYRFNQECLAEIQKARSRGLNYNHTNHVLGHAANIAEHLFQVTEEFAWGKRWYEDVQRAAEMSVGVETSFASISFGLAAKAAWALYEKTGDQGWAQKSYQVSRKSAEVAEQTDPRKAAVSYAYAENAAKELAKRARRDELRQKEWREKAQECYREIQRMISPMARCAYKRG